VSNVPPPEVAAAAAVVQRWLDTPVAKSADEIARMTPAERLDYSRQFNQSKMPPWQDPRNPRK
jgi:hypothetical protein